MNRIKKALSLIKRSKKTLIRRFDTPVIIVFTLLLFIISNSVFQFFSLRFDFSKGNAYTLAASTKKIVRSLDDVVNIKFYASSDLPAKLLPLKTEVKDLLEEYVREGKNKIYIKILDPKKESQSLAEAQKVGIPELQFSELQQDKYQITNSYLGLAITYGSRTEIIPQATDLTNLEYNITSLIFKLTNKQKEKIGLISPPSSNPEQDPYAVLRILLADQYDIVPLTLKGESAKPIDASIRTVLFIDEGNEAYETNGLKYLKEFVQKKGNLISFINGILIDENLSAETAKHNLFELFKQWGMTLNKNLILSSSAEFVNFGNNAYQVLTPYPFWVKTTLLDQKSGYFANVSQLTFPWVSSITLDKKKETTVLALSTSKSWEQKNTFDLLPQNISEPDNKDLNQYNLIAQTKIKNGGIVTLIPSSRFINVQYLSRNSGNIDFIFNLVNNLASNGALSGIRSRSISFYPLPNLPETQKEIFKYIHMLLLPVMFAVYGGVRLYRRK